MGFGIKSTLAFFFFIYFFCAVIVRDREAGFKLHKDLTRKILIGSFHKYIIISIGYNGYLAESSSVHCLMTLESKNLTSNREKRRRFAVFFCLRLRLL